MLVFFNPWLPRLKTNSFSISRSEQMQMSERRSAGAIAHAERVAVISRSVKSFYDHKIPFSIFYGSSNSTRAAGRQEIVDISGLKHIISINTADKTVLVEPGIAIDTLVQELLRYDLMLQVVPEFPGITAGGAFAGTATESSSFRYGYFDRTVSSVETVLSNGDGSGASLTNGERRSILW
jgi:delta24-sterol reductase